MWKVDIEIARKTLDITGIVTMIKLLGTDR